ncbi:MAG: hypothetical protein QXU24_06885, partial [Ignisphaera sp.]
MLIIAITTSSIAGNLCSSGCDSCDIVRRAVDAMDSRLCILCRGARYLCGRAYCPIVARMYVDTQVANIVRSNHLFGSSPPSVFIGRLGYPYVYAGPLAPPATGDTRIYDYPEQWRLMKLEDLLSLRLS